ncbi:MAG: hypothetical protein RL005_836, partial [Planctomycetota bacterium]
MTSMTVVRLCAIALTASVTLLSEVVVAIPQDAPAGQQGGQGGGQGGGRDGQGGGRDGQGGGRDGQGGGRDGQGGGRDGQGGGQRRQRRDQQAGQGQQDGGQAAPPPQGDRGQGGQGGGGQGGRGGFGGGGMGRMGGMGGLMRQFTSRMEPDFMKRDVPVIQEQLKLDDGQVTVVETFITDYADAFEPLAEETRTVMQDSMRSIMQSFMGGGMQERMRDLFDGVQKDMEQLQQENGGAEVDPEVRRKLFQERMDKLQQDITAERAANGQDAEQRRIMQEIVEASNRFLSKKVEMRKELVDGVKGVLRPEQLANWDAFERFLRRERAMGNGILSGESTNLIFVLDDADLTQAGIDATKAILDNYELQLDGALKARDEFLESSEPRLLKSMLDANTAESTRIVDQQISMRKAVRDVNERFRTEITQALPAEDGARFNLAALKAGYQRTYATTATQRMFEEASKIEGLSAETVAAITDLGSQYERELMAINDRIVSATKKQEVDRTKEDMERGLSMMNGTGSWSSMMGRGRGGDQGQPDPVRDAFDDRAKLAESYQSRLKALLTP